MRWDETGRDGKGKFPMVCFHFLGIYIFLIALPEGRRILKQLITMCDGIHQ